MKSGVTLGSNLEEKDGRFLDPLDLFFYEPIVLMFFLFFS